MLRVARLARQMELRNFCAAQVEPKAQTVRARGVDFYTLVAGSGPPVVCLCGSLGTAESDFGPQLRDLSAQHTVVAHDPRGYGKSQSEPRSFPQGFYARDAEDAAAVMATLGFEKYAVLGWSDGANSAVHLAALYPERVTRLALWGANVEITAEDVAAFEKTRDVRTGWSEKMLKSLTPVYGSVDNLQSMWSQACDAWARIQKEEGGDVCQEAAAKVRCPTLILHGAKDPIVLGEHPQRLHKLIAGSELSIHPEGKHNLHIRFAAEINPKLLEFLNRP